MMLPLSSKEKDCISILEKRGYKLHFSNCKHLEILKNGKVILNCDFMSKNSTDVIEKPGIIDIPDGDVISFKKIGELYILLTERIGLEYEDQRGRKHILKEPEEGEKWENEIVTK